MVDSLESSIVQSLDGNDHALFAHFDYLLQDLREIGSSAEYVLAFLEKHQLNTPDLNILDLGCGKGAITVAVAKKIGCKVVGIDAYGPFVRSAISYSLENGVSDRCSFHHEDAREAVRSLRHFDVIILGSIGPVLGSIGVTLEKLAPCLNDKGVVLYDDVYLPDDSKIERFGYLKQTEVISEIKNSAFEIVDEMHIDDAFMEKSDAEIYQCIEKRALELMQKYPEQKAVFEGYLRAQLEENQVLENEAQNVMWLLRKM